MPAPDLFFTHTHTRTILVSHFFLLYFPFSPLSNTLPLAQLISHLAEGLVLKDASVLSPMHQRLLVQRGADFSSFAPIRMKITHMVLVLSLFLNFLLFIVVVDRLNLFAH